MAAKLSNNLSNLNNRAGHCAVSSAPVQAQVPQQPVSPEQQQSVQSAEAMSSNAKMITDIIAPAIVTLAGNEEGEQRAKHVLLVLLY